MPAPSPLPLVSTRASGSSRAVEWYVRPCASGAMVVQDSVAGFQSSASSTGRVMSFHPGPLVPWVTSTSPSARIVAFICRRG